MHRPRLQVGGMAGGLAGEATEVFTRLRVPPVKIRKPARMSTTSGV